MTSFRRFLLSLLSVFLFFGGFLSVNSLSVSAADVPSGFVPLKYPEGSSPMIHVYSDSHYYVPLFFDDTLDAYSFSLDSSLDYISNVSRLELYEGSSLPFDYNFNFDLNYYLLIVNVFSNDCSESSFTYLPGNTVFMSDSRDGVRMLYSTHNYYNFLDSSDSLGFSIGSLYNYGYGFDDEPAPSEKQRSLYIVCPSGSRGSIPKNLYFQFYVCSIPRTLNELTFESILSRLDVIIDSINNGSGSASEIIDELNKKIDDIYSVPDGEDFGLSDIQDKVNDKMGLMSYGSDVMNDFCDLFSPDQEFSSEISFPGFSLPMPASGSPSSRAASTSIVIWDEINYDLTQIEEQFPLLISVVRTVTVMTVWIALLNYIVTVAFRSITGGD